MKAKILECAIEKLIPALIRSGIRTEMPSIHNNWRFNFNKHFNLPNSRAFILVTEENHKQIEGCLIFQMREKTIPYMSFIEIAPHNIGKKKKYDFVAGCLIAYAFQQSLNLGKGDYKGALLFDVKEEHESDQIKLMALYSKKYNAKYIGGTRMGIFDDDGNILITEYLER
ncbi:MAG: hypothetical protein IAF38_10315 [Bacteroidia bacterium]|nr:hypothetical protein [Bacteroidia bacterium]